MKSLKTFTITGYLSLFGWWLILSLHNIEMALAQAYFSFGLSLYFIILGIWSSVSLLNKSKTFKLKYAGIFAGLGIASLGLAYLNIFHLKMDVQRFWQPIIFNLFYFFQFPLSLTGLLLISERRGVFKKSAVVFISVVSLLLIISKFEYQLFFILYFMSKSLLLTLLSFLILIDKEEFSSLYIVFLGYLIWFFGDFANQYQNFVKGTAINGYTDILYLSAVFLVFLGTTRLIDRQILDVLDDNNDLISFRKISYQIPFSLNCFLD